VQKQVSTTHAKRILNLLANFISFDATSREWYMKAAFQMASRTQAEERSFNEGPEKSCRGWKKLPPDVIQQPKPVVTGTSTDESPGRTT
jgi:hypothetical protein